VRKPLKRPRGKPPSQVMRRAGSNCETVTGNARPFVIATCITTRSRGAMFPSILVTVGFHAG
jgi:hypothetical protein